MRTWLCALLLLLAATVPSWAASRAETRAFEAAVKAFRDGFFERADSELSGFVQAFPGSERRAEAILTQAQARCQLTNYASAIQLLSAELAGAGPRADEYHFWIGEAQYQSTNYPAAAAAFHAVVNDFPASKLRLQASVNEAAAWAGLEDWDRVIELLSQPAGVFQQLAKTAAASGPAATGVLLLAEAQLARGRFAAAETTIRSLDAAKLDAALGWKREFLLCRALLDGGHSEAALQGASNLLALAGSLAQPALRAQSVALQAAALEKLGQLDNAAASYTNNLAADAPIEMQRQALLKVGELALVGGRPTGLTEAAQAMERYLQRHSNSPACDMALLTLGELQLRQYFAPTGTNAANTNLLQQALTNLVAVPERFPQSPLKGRAQLDRGWCLLLASNLTDSAAAFAAAAEMLPASFDQATAWFKLADAQYQQQQLPAAISNYNRVVAAAAALPDVKTNLCEPALYQIVRAATEAGDLAAANAAADKILDWFPDGNLTEPSLLLTGQGLARHGNPADARRVFEGLVKRFPDSPRAPEARLRIARTYGLQREWPAAAQEYRAWLTAYPTNAEQPRAQYELALATYWANDETNALALFTSFITKFPTNTFTPQAQWWVAAYHFRHGEYAEVEKDCQLLMQSARGSALAYEAGMMAGRAAVAREAWSDAIGYFTNLTSDLNCPTNPVNLRVQALFGYGDALRRSEPADTNNPLANFKQAIGVFAEIHQSNPTNAAAARAWGEIGNCYLQLATRDTNQYTNASSAFRQVVNATWADAAARSQAAVGLGLVAEKQAELNTNNARVLLREALNHYLDVVYRKNLRDGEQPSVDWLKDAGLRAAKLAETLDGRPSAEKIYEELSRSLPALRPLFEKKLKKGA